MSYLEFTRYNDENLQYVMKFEHRFDPKYNGFTMSQPPAITQYLDGVFKDVALQMKLNKDAGNANITKEQVVEEKLDELIKKQNINPTDAQQYAIDYLNNFLGNTQSVLPPAFNLSSQNSSVTPGSKKPKLSWDTLMVGDKVFMPSNTIIESVIGAGKELTYDQETLLNDILDDAQRKLKTLVHNNPFKDIKELRSAALSEILNSLVLANNIDKKNNSTSKQEQDDMDTIINIIGSM